MDRTPMEIDATSQRIEPKRQLYASRRLVLEPERGDMGYNRNAYW